MLAMGFLKHFLFLSYSAIWWYSLEKAESNKADFSSAHSRKDSNFQFCLSQAYRHNVFWVIWLLLL